MKLHYISSASIWKPLDIFKWWGDGIEIVVQLYQNISFLRVIHNSRYWFIPTTSSLSLFKILKEAILSHLFYSLQPIKKRSGIRRNCEIGLR